MDIVTLALAKKSAKQYTDDVIEGLGKGIIYKGAVNYYNDLPNNAEIGDCYSVLYKGTTGTDPSGIEYVWGKVNGSSSASWIQLSADLSNFESSSNKVTSLTNASTDIQYPSAKCVYSLVKDINTLEEVAGTATDTFSTSKTYKVGDIVIKDNKYYRCITAITTAGAWNSSQWEELNIRTEQDEQNERLANAEKYIQALEDNFDVATTPNSDDFTLTDSASGFTKNIKIGDGPELSQFTTTGKNLFDSDVANKTVDTYVTFSNGKITFLPTVEGRIEAIVFKTDAYTKDVEYTFSFTAKSSEANAQIVFDGQPDSATGTYRFTDTPFTLTTTPARYSVTGTITSDFTGLRFFRTPSKTGALTATIEITDIQLELGSTATDYEPYTGGNPSPNPDYPQNVVVVEGSSTVHATTKNFITVTKYNETNYISQKVLLIPGNYIVHYTGDASSAIYVRKADGTTPINGTVITEAYNRTTYAFTINETSECYIQFYKSGGYSSFLNAMLEWGSIGSSYVPHQGQTYPITLPTGMFLGAIGTASNYIHGTKDNWKLHSGLTRYIFDGSNNENWTLNNSGTANWFYQIIVSTESKLLVNFKSKSNYGLNANVSNMNTTNGIGILGDATASGKDLIRSRYGEEDTIINWKAKLAQKNMIVYAVLITPTETDITDSTLVSQLNNIADNLQTYKGETIVFTSSDNLAPNIQFDYMVNPLASIEARLDLLEA